MVYPIFLANPFTLLHVSGCCVHYGVWCAYVLLFHAGGGGWAVRLSALMLQGHYEDLHSLLHQLLTVVGEEQVVVGDPVTHRVISAHHVQQGGEERQSVSLRKTDNVSDVCTYKTPRLDARVVVMAMQLLESSGWLPGRC